MKVATEFEKEGARVLTISQDLFVPKAAPEKALAKVKAFAEARGMKFPVWILEDKTLDPLNAAYDLPGPIPCTLAFDANGKEVDRCEGDADEERFRQMFRRALGKEPPAQR